MEAEHWNLLILLFLPLVAGIIVAALGSARRDAIRWISLLTSLVVLLLALTMAERFTRLADSRSRVEKEKAGDSVPTFRPEFVPGARSDNPNSPDHHRTSWDLVRLGPGTVQFYIGLDGLNVWLVVLTAVLMLPSVLISWNHITDRVNEFFAWLMILQTCMLGIFMAFDIIIFYVFFELSLVPLFFLIGIWGGPQRRHAARKFFMYTLAGSLLTFLGVLGIVIVCHHRADEMTFSIPRLVELVHERLQMVDESERSFWYTAQWWIFLALTVGFAVKVPLVPFHTWLPLAHVEAPTAGSVDLAGVLLKVGAYGFLRLCIPLAPDASLALGLPLVTLLATIGIVYGALCAYGQDDIKKMIAYSSVSHLGLCMLGMFSLTVAGVSGSIMQMINHGLSTGALFLLIGMLYDRYHTRQISSFSGMATRMPYFSVFLVFICLSSVGLPGLNGFIGEYLCLAGIFSHEWTQGGKPILAIIACSGVVLGAWYLFTMVRRVLFGPLLEPETHSPTGDLDAREVALLAPIAALCLFIGIYPQPILEASEPDVRVISRIASGARQRAAQSINPIERVLDKR